MEEVDDDSFCFYYFQGKLDLIENVEKFKEERTLVVKQCFKNMTANWQMHWVVYPLNVCEDI